MNDPIQQVLTMKVAVPDTKVLRDRLKKFRAGVADIEEGKALLEQRKRDAEDQIKTVDFKTMKTIDTVSSMRLQAEILPGIIQRHTDKLAATLGAELVALCTTLENALRASLIETAEARHHAIAEAIAPLFPGERFFVNEQKTYPNGWVIAEKSELRTRLLVLAERVDYSRHEEAAQRENWMVELPEAVDSLLKLADEAATL